MAKEADEQPDMKKVEKCTRDAKALAKKLDQCKKELIGLATQVKKLKAKVS